MSYIPYCNINHTMFLLVTHSMFPPLFLSSDWNNASPHQLWWTKILKGELLVSEDFNSFACCLTITVFEGDLSFLTHLHQWGFVGNAQSAVVKCMMSAMSVWMSNFECLILLIPINLQYSYYWCFHQLRRLPLLLLLLLLQSCYHQLHQLTNSTTNTAPATTATLLILLLLTLQQQDLQLLVVQV